MNLEAEVDRPEEPGPRNQSWCTLPIRSVRVATLVTALAGMLVHANTLGNGFARDDIPVIVENELIHDLSRLPEALTRPYWTGERGSTSGIWRPLSTGAFAVEWALWRDNPAPYHAVNVVAHGLATAAATLVMAELAPLGAAFVGGLVFAVHPVHVEAVANVIGFSELLATALLLISLWVFLRHRREGFGLASIALISGLYGLAFLTKENTAVLPALFVLVDAWKDRLEWKDLGAYAMRRAALFAALAMTAATILWVRFQVLGSIANPVPPLGAQLLEEIPRIWTLPVVWLHYLRLLFFPVDLIPDYSPGVIDIQLGWTALNLAGVVAIVAILALAWAIWRWERSLDPVTLGVLWFGVTILPVANIFFLSEILLAERTLYLPSLGWAMSVGVLLWHLGGRSPLLTVSAAAVIILPFTVRTWIANPTWNDTGSILSRLMDQHPESGRAQWMWADILFDEQDDPDRALDVYRLAVSTTRGSYPVMHDVTEDLLSMGAFSQAAVLAEIMWQDRPEDPRGPAQLATAQSRIGNHDRVIEPGLAALELAPENAVLHHLVATSYREQGLWEEALHHRKATIEEGEGGRWQQWRWLGELQLQLGDTAAARVSLDSALTRAADPAARSMLDSLYNAWGR